MSSAYVPVATMPGWLQGFAMNPPLTQMVNTARLQGRAGGGATAGAPGLSSSAPSLLWTAGLIVVFAPLAVWKLSTRDLTERCHFIPMLGTKTPVVLLGCRADLTRLPRKRVTSVSGPDVDDSVPDNLAYGTVKRVRALRLLTATPFFSALDAQRRHRQLGWHELADELWQQSSDLNEQRTDHPLCGTQHRDCNTWGNLLPVCTVHAALASPRTRGLLTGAVVDVGEVQIAQKRELIVVLRWNLNELHAVLNKQRRERDRTWAELGHELGCTPNRLTNLRNARLADMDLAMRITQWLGQPAAAFIHPAQW